MECQWPEDPQMKLSGLWSVKQHTHNLSNKYYKSSCTCCLIQSGEAGVTLAFTIIPIHDDNIDINYEPVSILVYTHIIQYSSLSIIKSLLYTSLLTFLIPSLPPNSISLYHPLIIPSISLRNMCVHTSTTHPRQMRRFHANLWGSSLRKEIFWKLATKMTPIGGR